MNEKEIMVRLGLAEGKIEALFALVTALANEVPKENFRKKALQSLEINRNTLTFSKDKNAEIKIQALDDVLKWIDGLTS